MKLRSYVIRSKTLFSDKDHTDWIDKALTGMGVEHSISEGVADSRFVRFKANKKDWKFIKKRLNLVIDNVFCNVKD